MTYQFKNGDPVQVSRIAGSTWQDRHGTVISVTVRFGGGPVEECEVSVGSDHRRFLARHLIRTVHPKWIRLFRSAALDRWKLDPDTTALLNGDLNQLIEVLCDHCQLTIPRAHTEAHEFYEEFDRRTLRAAAVVAPVGGRYERSREQPAA